MPSPKSPVILATNDQTARAPLASWYAQGPSDGFGDRLLMFDNAKTGPLELLRIRPDFAVVPGFEAALRTRFDRLASFNNRGFAQARVVKQLEQGEGLTIVSNHVAGTRLSELFLATRPHPGMHPASVRAVFGELVSSIAELHRQGRDIAHGAIAPERIVLTSERRLIVTDYVFGDALQRVQLSMERLWGEFGVVVSEDAGSHALDQRCDVVQLGLVMLSLVLGRHVSPAEYPRQLAHLVQDFTTASDRRARDVTPTLKTWLEQALDPSGFKNAIEAERAMVQPQALPRSFDVRMAAIDATLEERRLQPAAEPAVPAVSIPADAPTAAVAAQTETPTPAVPPAVAPVVEGADAAAARATLVTEPIVIESNDELDPSLARELSLLRESILDVDVVSVHDAEPQAAPRIATPSAAPPAPEPATRISPSLLRTPDERPGSSVLRGSILKPEAPTGESEPRSTDRVPSRELFGQRAAAAVDLPEWKPVDDRASWEPAILPPQPVSMFRWVALALGILVLVQGAIIFRLATRSTAAPVSRPVAASSAAARESVPAQQAADREAATATAAGIEASTAAQVPPAAAPAAAAPAAPAIAITPSAAVARTPTPEPPARGRTGSVRVVSPISLQVLSGDQPIGSTSSPIRLAAGSYDLTLVNDALNFRTQQTVRIAVDRTVSISVAPPPGAISVNASPWAQVWIDGKQIGETPLANISVPIGEHDVVFRHPQFGERRQKILVQAGTMARASVTFAP